MATYDLSSYTPSSIKAGDIINCPYSGTYKSITLPKGTYKLEVWGAEGGYRDSSTYSGKGGYSVGTLALSDKKTLYLYAGGAGGNTTSNAGSSTLVAGGFNGGGSRYGYKGGGGGSDIRIASTSLYARVIVAGGGGSCGATSKQGMYGGGTTGGSATQSYGSGGGGGTQTAGGTGGSGNAGTFGVGGNGLYRSSGYAGAGGGGWYGGGGSYPDGSGDDDRGGGGGSGYIYTSSTASNYPSGCLLNSSYYLTSASMTAGNLSFTSPTGSSETGHSGNGYCRITAITVDNKAVYRKISGNWVKQDAGFNLPLQYPDEIKFKLPSIILGDMDSTEHTVPNGTTFRDFFNLKDSSSLNVELDGYRYTAESLTSNIKMEDIDINAPEPGFDTYLVSNSPPTMDGCVTLSDKIKPISYRTYYYLDDDY